jgi:hypothetical protein
VNFATGTEGCPTDNAGTLDSVPVFNIQYSDLANKTLVPGIYNVASAITLSGLLFLKADVNDADAEWIFNIGDTLNTVAASEMLMEGGGRPATVHWIVDSAITLGANSIAIGDMSSTGAFNLGTGIFFIFDDDEGDKAEWTFNIGGALATAAGTKMVKKFDHADSKLSWNVDGAMTLGADSIAKGDMNSLHGAITVGAAARSEDLDAFGAITLGARACSGTVDAIGAITLGVLVLGTRTRTEL